MSRPLPDIIAQIDGIRSADSTDDLAILDAAVGEVFASAHPEQAVDALLRVFERFPTQDGHGVFWAILHGLEGLSGQYEAKLVESVRRLPSEFSLVMVNRMLNAGERTAGGVPLLALLADVAGRETCPSPVRARAQHLLAFQQSKAEKGPTA